MPGIIDDQQLTVLPMLVEQDSLIDGTDHVVATMHDKTGYIFQFMCTIKYLPGFQEATIDKIVAFDTRDTQGNMWVAKMIYNRFIG